MTRAADGSVLINTKMDTSGMTAGMKQVEKSIGSLGSALKKLGGIIATVFAVKQVIAFSKECIELGSDLQEVQNVVDVTFGKMSGVIDQFAKEAAVNFGISELAAKQYTSTIGAMYKSMGFAEDAAAGMSIEMTKLAADMASFYNLDADTAFNKIRSGISGETEPLKQLGINLSEANLEEFRLAQGIETSYSKMDQQNKALLRYNYLLSVTSDAQGDFARTSGSWANQVKVLHLQFQQIKADLGAGFINVLTPVLQVINKLLQGLAKLAASFKAFTELITGKKASGSITTNTGAEDVGDAYDDATASANAYAKATNDAADATKAAKKANDKYVSGLDHIHKFQKEAADETSTKNKKTPTAATQPANNLAKAITEDYGKLAEGDSVVDKLAKKMKDLYDKITKGAQPAITALKRLWNQGLSQLGKFTWNALKGFYEHFLVPVGKWVLGEGIPRFVDALNNGLMAVDWQKINKALEDLWDVLAPFAVNVGEGLLWLWENVLVPLRTWTMNEVVPRFLKTLTAVIRTANAIITAAKPAFKWFWDNLLQPIAKWTGGVILKVWDKLNGLLNKFAKWCEDNPKVIENITTFIIAFFAALAGITVVTQVITMIKTIGTLVAAFGAIVTGLNPVTIIIAAVIAAGVLLWKNWDTVKAKAKEIWTAIANFLSKTWTNIKKTSEKVWNAITKFLKKTWNNIQKTAKDTFVKIQSAATSIYNGIKEKVTSKWNEIKASLANVWTKLKESASNTFKNIKEATKTLYEGIKDTLTEKWEAIKSGVAQKWKALKSSASSWFKQVREATKTMYTGIKDTLTGKWEAIKEAVKKKWEAMKKAASSWATTITSASSAMFKGIKDKLSDRWGKIKETLVNKWTSIKTKAGSMFESINKIIQKGLKAPNIDETWKKVKEKLVGFANSVKGAFTGMASAVKEKLSGMFTGAVESVKTPINGVIGAMNKMISGVVSIINGVIGTINKIHVKVPSWVPGVGGKTFGFKLGKITSYPQIPYLAQGAVIPPNAPFAAVLGDQRNGTNIETPESLLRQIVRDESGGKTITLKVFLDRKVIYETVVDEAKARQRMTGSNQLLFG